MRRIGHLYLPSIEICWRDHRVCSCQTSTRYPASEILAQSIQDILSPDGSREKHNGSNVIITKVCKSTTHMMAKTRNKLNNILLAVVGHDHE